MLSASGCVSTWHIGSAVLYNNQHGHDQRISSSTLAAEVANLTTFYNKYKHKTQINYTPASMPQMVLSWMLRFAAEEKLAHEQHPKIKVTAREAQNQLNIEKQRLKTSGDTLEEAAVLNGLPPDMLSQLGTWIEIQVKIDRRLDNNHAPTSTTGQAALAAKTTHLLCLAAKDMHIKVNPQYGVYDYKNLAVVAKPATLSAPSPAPSATPIQTTPKC
jgi:hypothetical protein